MPTERVTFPGSGGAQLAARFEQPAGARPRAHALFAHCFTCSKDLKAAVNITRELARLGIAVLRFDFTGLGESEGDFADTNFSSNVADLVAACRYLSEHHRAPQILIGHSLGGAAVLQAAGQLDEVRAVATIGAPSDPRHVVHLFADAREEIERAGDAVVRLAGRSFRVKRQFLDDLANASLEDTIGTLRRALLVMHSPVDQIVGIDHAAAIYQAAKHPKSFVSLDSADHLLTRERDSRYVASVLGAWVSRYVDEPAARERKELAGLEVVTTTGRELQTEITAGPHGLVSDEPASVGGSDTGPTPYDLLSASLGACTGMTLRLYADRKGWPLERVTVGLKHSRIHADDSEKCEGREARVDRIDRWVRLTGDLDDAQRKRLLEIADKCPVHKTLSAGIKIETQEVDARTGAGT